MKTTASIFWTFCLTAILHHALAQEQWGLLKKGKYSVGFRDTMIFCDQLNYTLGSYSGAKPIIVYIWYPLAASATKAKKMKYGDYLNLPRNVRTGAFTDTLANAYRNIVMEDGVAINLKPNGEAKDEKLYNTLYSRIMATGIPVTKNALAAKGKFPAIFYHHGSRSTPFDNTVFFEYMASQGFVVVSTSYWLPHDHEGTNQSPNESYWSKNYKTMNTVLGFMQSLDNVDTSKLFAVGHSWGAQSFLRYDSVTTRKPFKKIISLHTTIEDKSKEQIATMWQDLQYIERNECANSTTPTVLLAPVNIATIIDEDTVTGKETILGIDTLYPKFRAFKANKTTPYTFVTLRHAQAHNSFTSVGNIRYSLAKKYHLPDSAEIRTDQLFYERIVRFTHAAIMSSIDHKPVKLDADIERTFKVE